MESNVSLVSGYPLEMASGLGMGICPLFRAGTPFALELSRPCGCCHCLFEFQLGQEEASMMVAEQGSDLCV